MYIYFNFKNYNKVRYVNIKTTAVKKDKADIKDKVLSNLANCEIFIHVLDRNLKEINKIHKCFKEALKIALKSETIKQALNSKIQIFLKHSEYSGAYFCTSENNQKQIYINTKFDDIIPLKFTNNSKYQITYPLSTLIFEVGNSLNKAINLTVALLPLIHDRDLFGLITEYNEFNTNLIANKILSEIIYDLFNKKQETQLCTEDFIESWKLSNSVIKVKNSITHTEFYRQKFDEYNKTGSKIFNINDIEYPSEELKNFIYKFYADVSKMYDEKVEYLPTKEIFDEFIVILYQSIEDNDIKMSGEIISTKVSVEDNDIKISGDIISTQMSVDLLFTQVSVEVNDICTLF